MHFAISPSRAEPVAWFEIKPERVSELAAQLPEMPTGCHGRPITDRAYWTSPATRDRAVRMTKNVESFRTTPLPAWDDDAYLDFSRTGQRPRGQEMMSARSTRLAPLVLAECMEDEGRYLTAIHDVLRGLVAQPTWTLPAHDVGLHNFRREAYEVDLGSAIQAADLAQALWLLGDRVEPEVRRQVVAAVRERVLDPILQSLRTGKGHWWLGSERDPVKNNWNAVCLAGSVYAALTLVEDRDERAVFVAAGEHYIRYFLNGIRPSGFCDEGGGYWVYGFGLFCHLRETLVRQTGGEVELFTLPRAKEGALFGERYQLTDRLMPTFSDSRNDLRVDVGLENYCRVALRRGGDADTTWLWGPRLCTILVEATPLEPGKLPSSQPVANDAIRSYFQDVGVLVCRPAPASAARLAVAIKAGGNTSHSHNDVGSFVVSLGGELPLGDPGGPTMYDSKTFGSERFNRKLLNSYGHPLPVLGGKLQRDATRVHVKVLSTSFADDVDTIVIDIAPAYDLPAIRRATRTLTYRRDGTGSVLVHDEFEFAEPTAVESALTTRGEIEVLEPGRIRFTAGHERVIATLRGPATEEPKVETFTELGVTFRRVGFALREPAVQASIDMEIAPE
jgi:hypothetical protein